MQIPYNQSKHPNIMKSGEAMKRIHPIFLPAVSLLLAALLALLRSWQLRAGLSFWLMPLVLLAAALIWLLFSRWFPDGQGMSESRDPLVGLLFLLGGAAFAVSSCMTLYENIHGSLDLVGLAADVLGLGMALACCVLGAAVWSGKTCPPVLRILIYAALLIRLVQLFRSWSVDPLISDYCFQHFAMLLAIFAGYCCTTLALGKGRRRLAAFWCMSGMGFCAVALCGEPLQQSLLYFGLCLILMAQLSQIRVPAKTEEEKQ